MSRPWGIGVSECRIYNEIEAINQKQASMFNKAKVGNVITAKVYVTKEDMTGHMREQELVRRVTVIGKYLYFLRCKDKDDKIHCVDKMAIVSI